MASLDVVILSSSPQRQFTNYTMSSSPLPSLSELRQKKAPMLCTGSQAASIPQYASASFTSTATLFKSSKDLLGGDGIGSLGMDSGDNGPIEELPKPSKAKPRKSASKKPKYTDEKDKAAKVARKTAKRKDIADGEAQPRKPRKSKAKATDQDVGDNDTVKIPAAPKPRSKKTDKEANGDEVKLARKPRAKKVDHESQPKISKGQVTKVSSEKTSKSKKPESVMPDPFTDPGDFGLVEAVKRRTDWTPPIPTAKATDITPVAQLDLGLMSDISRPSAENTKGFTDLFGSFGFSKLDNNTTDKKMETVAPRKRKLIELVKTSVSTAAAASPKEKAPRKKAKTITEQATSAYAEEEEETTTPAPLLQYFSRQITEISTKDGFKIPPKPRSKSPTKGLLKSKKGSAEAPILLSPESALKQIGNQDFVFGTSSQLAREDSPTLLRDLHEAMQASNKEIDDDPFADSVDSVQLAVTHGENLVPSAKRNLWAAASRDSAGDLLGVEMVYLVDSPLITRERQPRVLPAALDSTEKQAKLDVWHDVDAVGANLPLSTQTVKKAPRVGPVEAAIRAELLSSPPSSSKTNESSPRKSKDKQREGSPSGSSKSPTKASKKAVKSVQMPDFSTYTTSQLQKEIASYRFKPVKNRDQMITLLEKCWEGKNRIALGTLGTNVLSTAPIESSKSTVPASSQLSPSSPKRPRGRPRKDSAVVSPAKAKVCRPRKEIVTESPPSEAKVGRPKKSYTVEYLEIDSDTPLSQVRTPKKSKKKAHEHAEDIYDSDIRITPSPRRRRASQTKSPPLKLTFSTTMDVATSPEISPTSSQALLFTHITRAVKNAPPTKDTSSPSWYEKILLYDPIILEDLTVWLNTGALEKAGWDGEVEPKEVKKWCESKSICCLWRENLRGVGRSRY